MRANTFATHRMPDPKTSRSPRFTLRTFLIAVAIFAAMVVIFQLSSELYALRREVRKLRAETGQLTIYYPKKLHAIQMATDYPLAWKWRIYVPGGRTVRVASQNHHISKNSLPSTKNGLTLSGPDEFVVTVKLDKEPDGRWRTSVSDGGSTIFFIFPEDATQWLNKGHAGSMIGQVGREVAVEQADQPMVLLRQRVYYDTGQIPPANEPEETDGILVWLAE